MKPLKLQTDGKELNIMLHKRDEKSDRPYNFDVSGQQNSICSNVSAESLVEIANAIMEILEMNERITYETVITTKLGIK